MSLQRAAASDRANATRQHFTEYMQPIAYRPAPTIDELRARYHARRAAQ